MVVLFVAGHIISIQFRNNFPFFIAFYRNNKHRVHTCFASGTLNWVTRIRTQEHFNPTTYMHDVMHEILNIMCTDVDACRSIYCDSNAMKKQEIYFQPEDEVSVG